MEKEKMSIIDIKEVANIPADYQFITSKLL